LVGDVWETGTLARASLGTGFRPPALAENLFPFGNPDLQPETSRGWECGLQQQLAGGQAYVAATYFRNDFNNLILFDLNTFVLENIGSAAAHGVEVVGSWAPSDQWLIDASYTRTDTLDAETMAPLVRRPRDKGSLAVTWLPDDRASVRLLALFVGPRTETRDGAVVLDEYVLGNLAARYLLRDGVRLIGRIDNLFDARYEQSFGFATPGFSAFAGVQLFR
jgi:vitamin B12 transporter